MKKKTKIIGLSVAVLVFGAWISGIGITKKGVSGGVENVSAKTATVYKSPSCGCCANYVSYLRRNGFEVEMIETDDMDTIKNEHNIPGNMESCHTTIINDGYVVEGHIPVKAVNKLLEEKPSVNGIAMPGMPVGSPGMPGSKKGLFTIYQMDDGGTSEFMQL
ncbi:MAG: hypothetical protein L3J07_01795 [Candidatus Magasanikbacteria bacterium]|nr:hypothetical protein [Candidatus Magasanikbacteria bacterium]